MLHVTDAMIDRHVTAADAQAAMLEAFQSFGCGEAAMQERIRTEAGGVKLSTLGAVIPAQQVDRKSTRLNSSHVKRSRMPSSA